MKTTEADSPIIEATPSRSRQIAKIGAASIAGAFTLWNAVINANLAGPSFIHTYFGEESTIEQKLEDALGGIKELQVNCLSPGSVELDFGERVGTAPYFAINVFALANIRLASPDIINLDEQYCATAALSLNKRDTITLLSADEAFAWDTVLHEVQHTNGTLNEAETECKKTQLYSVDMQAIGFNKNQSEEAEWRTAIDIAGTEYYDAEKCRPGGEYDLQIGSSFPRVY